MANDENVRSLKRHIYALYVLILLVFCFCVALLSQMQQYRRKFVTRQLVAETLVASQSVSIEGPHTKVYLSNRPSVVLSRTYPVDTEHGGVESSSQIALFVKEPGFLQGSEIWMSQQRRIDPNVLDTASVRLECTGNFLGLDMQARGTEQRNRIMTEPISFGISGHSSVEPTPRYRPRYHLPELNKRGYYFDSSFESDIR